MLHTLNMLYLFYAYYTLICLPNAIQYEKKKYNKTEKKTWLQKWKHTHNVPCNVYSLQLIFDHQSLVFFFLLFLFCFLIFFFVSCYARTIPIKSLAYMTPLLKKSGNKNTDPHSLSFLPLFRFVCRFFSFFLSCFSFNTYFWRITSSSLSTSYLLFKVYTHIKKMFSLDYKVMIIIEVSVIYSIITIKHIT